MSRSHSRERGGQILGACLDRLRNRDREASVTRQNVARSHYRQTDDPAGCRRVPDDMALRGLLALADLRLTDVEIQDVVIGVVVGLDNVMVLFYAMAQRRDMVDHAGLYRVAESQAGLFTARQAADAGMGRTTLSHHAGRDGRFERVARGVYRLRQFPTSPHQHVVAAWLSLRAPDAAVSHASALELHELSDVVADEVHLTVPRSARSRHRRPGLRLHFVSQPVAAGERQRVFGLPVTTVERTIADYAQNAGQPEQIEMAVAQALAQGLTTAGRLQVAAQDRSVRVRGLIERAIEQAR